MTWGQACKSYLEKPLKLQKRDLSFIYISERNQHSIPLFTDAGVLPNPMFEIRHRNAPSNIQDSDIHS